MNMKLTATKRLIALLVVCGIVAVPAAQLAHGAPKIPGTVYLALPKIGSVFLPQFVPGITPITIVASLDLPAGSYYVTATVLGQMHSPNLVSSTTTTLYCD